MKRLGIIISLLLMSVYTSACSDRELAKGDVVSEEVTPEDERNYEEVEAVSLVELVEINRQSQLFLTKIPTSRLVIRDIEIPEVEKEILDTLGDFQAVSVEEETTLTLPDNILFDFDSYDLLDGADEVLDKLVQVIEAAEGDVQIDGHTDHIGDESYNQQLSKKRAEAVLQTLVDKGIDEMRLQANGYGAKQPIASNTRPDGTDDEEGRKKNRRVEVTVKGLFEES